ncbi:MAG: toxin-antitoxin system YwqK family antitoxin [Chlamydiales bacterium]|nr:toxin-antitoxin system YwqK family antitoxin [Chlamydiales bacterium]
MHKERYETENGRLTLIDEELGLHLECAFDSEKGARYTHYPDKKIESCCYYDGELLHGPSIFYSKTGVVLSRSWYIKGVRQGKMWQYYTSGSLSSVQRYKDGLLTGKQEYYYEDGKIKSLIFYDSGHLHGELLLYYPDGKLKRHTYYAHGKREGTDRIWNPKGVLIQEGALC